MQRFFLHSKLHGMIITHADINYQGSLGIDSQIMKAANILPNEQVCIYNVSNGQRLSTYAIPTPEGARIFSANGACAHLVRVNDKVIVCTYAMLSEKEQVDFKPTVLLFNSNSDWHYLPSQQEFLAEQLCNDLV